MALEIITSNKNKRIAGFSGRMFRVDEVKDESIRWRCLTTSCIGKQSAPAGPEHDNPIHHVLTAVLHACFETAVLSTAILTAAVLQVNRNRPLPRDPAHAPVWYM